MPRGRGGFANSQLLLTTHAGFLMRSWLLKEVRLADAAQNHMLEEEGLKLGQVLEKLWLCR